MRKVTISIVVGFLLVLSACGWNDVAGQIDSTPDSAQTSGVGQTEFDQDTSSASDDIQAAAPEEHIIIPFESAEEMLLALEASQYQAHTTTSATGVNILESIAEQSITGFPVPMYHNAELPLRNASNLDNILVEPYSVFGMPMFWYYAELDGASVIITVGILPNEQIEQIGNGGIAALKDLHTDILATLPEDPNADDVPITTTQSELLIGGNSISVMMNQYAADPRYHVEFIAENAMYVKIYVYPEDYDRGVLAGLSFSTELVTARHP